MRRISIGPGEVAGYFSRLKAGFDELGVPCEHFALSASKFSYHESDYFLKRPFLFALGMRNSNRKLLHWSGRLLSLSIRMIVFVYALVRCDVFIFNGFCSFLWFRELPLLKILGKKVLVVYLGSDSRPPIFSGRHLDDEGGYVDPTSASEEAARLLRRIRKVEQYADIIVNHTATAQFFSRLFIRFMAIGMPIESGTDEPTIATEQPCSIRILHAPSRPLAKGSDVFRQVINELRAEGYSIDFVELTGVPNSTVLQELEKCDFVVDELYSDVPMAMLATEAAMFGKPVIVGGYYAKQCRDQNQDIVFPPSYFVDPSEIKPAIRKMIDDRKFRRDLGMRAYTFIRDNWNARKVAENYLLLIGNNIPENWVSNPRDLDYYWGWGLSKDNWREQVGSYISKLGAEALLLDHNPRLKMMVLDEIRRHADMAET